MPALDRYTLCGVAALLMWSTTFALAGRLAEQVGALTAGTTVNLIAGVGCVIMLCVRPAEWRRIRRLSRRYLWIGGALFVMYMAVLYPAIGLTHGRRQVVELALVNYLWPALTVLGAVLLLRRPATLWLWPGTLLAVVGIALVVWPGGSWRTFAANLADNPAPYGLALIAALSWALYSNLARKWAGAGDGGAIPLFIPATGLVLLAMRLLQPEPITREVWTARAIAEALGLGLANIAANLLWDIAMRRGRVLVVGVASYFTPLLSTTLSCLYLHVAAGPVLWLGCLLLVGGSLLSWWAVRERIAEPAALPVPADSSA